MRQNIQIDIYVFVFLFWKEEEQGNVGYDAWGNLRDPQTHALYTESDMPALFLERGYTGHEHMPEFGLINMNGWSSESHRTCSDGRVAKDIDRVNARLYDPVLGRFLSPDPYVQMPDNSQNFNRYCYCLNNPLRYADKTGELFGLSLISGFLKGILKWVKGGKITDPLTYAYKNTINDLKSYYGMFFKGSPKQIFSRFTKELPQTIVGRLYTDYRFALAKPDHVYFYDGATYVINNNNSKDNGVTIGSFININITHTKYYDDKGHFAPYKSSLLMHEYGHYLQSQDMGWSYLFKIGIPSLRSAIKYKGPYKKYPNHFYSFLDGEKEFHVSKHNFQDYEVDASKRGYEHFGDKGRVYWDYNNYPYDLEWYYSRYIFLR